MVPEIKTYKINDFIRINESGKIDSEKSIKLVRELAAVITFNAGHNILMDLRKQRFQIAT